MHSYGDTPTTASWSIRSHMCMSQPSWMTDRSPDDAPYTRLSIGMFMGARTEALGSLDGDTDTPRVGSINSYYLPVF